MAANSAAICCGSTGAQAQQHHRQKGENRHALQDIEEGHQDVLNTGIVCRGTTIPQRKEQRQEVRRGHTHDGEAGIIG